MPDYSRIKIKKSWIFLDYKKIIRLFLEYKQIVGWFGFKKKVYVYTLIIWITILLLGS